MTELPSHNIEDVEAAVRELSLWQGIRAMTPLKGGVSNAAFVVDDESGRFVARVGTDYPFHQVSRAREAQAHRAAFEAGLSPELIFARDGVMVVKFIEARTYGEPDVRGNWQDCLELVMRTHRDVGHRIRGQGAIFWVFQISCATMPKPCASPITAARRNLPGSCR